MQKWEYAKLLVFDHKVLEVNGQQVGDISFFSGAKGPPLYEYLNHMGKEGWEVVGLSPATSTGEARGSVEIIVILKRPLP